MWKTVNKKKKWMCFSILKTMSRKDRKRVNPIEESRKWSEKNIDPPGFNKVYLRTKAEESEQLSAEMQATFC